MLLLLPVAIYAVTLSGTRPGDEPPLAELPGLGLDAAPISEDLYQQALVRLEQRLQLYPLDHEASLLKGLIQFRSGERDAALAELSALTEREPKFHLAHLVLGDLRLASTHVVNDIGQLTLFAQSKESRNELARLREEAEVRLRGYLDSLPQGRLPSALLMMDNTLHTALVVDKHNHRLYVYERGDDGLPRLMRDLYVSTGRANGNKNTEGDLRTPEGVYFITRHIPGNQLPDLYGYGAWPMNYPNEWDKHQGKTGHGIWLHGTEQVFYSRPPLDSEGCVVLPNIDLERIAEYLHPGRTPIIVTDQVEWLEVAEWTKKRNGVRQAIEQWRNDWASNDSEAYLSHYADDFWSGKHQLESWKAYKQRVARGKKWQQIELSDLSLFAYPRKAGKGKDIVVANFRQDYDSNNFRSSMNKRLYLVEQDGAWRIMYEGAQ
jgi:murein L,D-transpeptidase YafK